MIDRYSMEKSQAAEDGARAVGNGDFKQGSQGLHGKGSVEPLDAA